MNKRRLSILLALLFAMPVFAAFTNDNLSNTLSNLRSSLKRDYEQMSRIQGRLSENYEH